MTATALTPREKGQRVLLRCNAFLRKGTLESPSLDSRDGDAVKCAERDTGAAPPPLSPTAFSFPSITSGLRHIRTPKTSPGRGQPSGKSVSGPLLQRSNAFRDDASVGGVSHRTVPVPRDVWEAAEQNELDHWEADSGASTASSPRSAWQQPAPPSPTDATAEFAGELVSQSQGDAIFDACHRTRGKSGSASSVPWERQEVEDEEDAAELTRSHSTLVRVPTLSHRLKNSPHGTGAASFSALNMGWDRDQ